MGQQHVAVEEKVGVPADFLKMSSVELETAAGGSSSNQQPALAAAIPSDFVHAAKDVLSSIVGSAMCVYTGQPFDTGM